MQGRGRSSEKNLNTCITEVHECIANHVVVSHLQWLVPEGSVLAPGGCAVNFMPTCAVTVTMTMEVTRLCIHAEMLSSKWIWGVPPVSPLCVCSK